MSQVAILIVGSVLLFIYMMTSEIFNSIRHARRIHLAKKGEKEAEVAQMGPPGSQLSRLERQSSIDKLRMMTAAVGLAGSSNGSDGEQRQTVVSDKAARMLGLTGTTSKAARLLGLSLFSAMPADSPSALPAAPDVQIRKAARRGSFFSFSHAVPDEPEPSAAPAAESEPRADSKWSSNPLRSSGTARLNASSRPDARMARVQRLESVQRLNPMRRVHDVVNPLSDAKH